MAMSARLLRPIASGLNLRQIAGLLDWWDASVTSSLVLNGGFVEQWNPLAGSRPLTQSISNDRPGIGVINGRASVLFDGSNDHLNNTTLGSQTKTIVAVIAANSGGTQGILGEGDSSNTANRKFIHASGGFVSFSRQSTAVGSIAIKSTAAPQIVLASYETSEALRVDGATSGGTPSALISTTTGFVIGARFFSGVASTFYNGHVCEVATFSRVLSATEITLLERHLARKWGITLAPQVSNAEAQDWVNRVYANGGTVSTSTASAVSTFCDAIEAAGIRDRYYRLSLMCGTGLNAALVPLYRGPVSGGTTYGNTTDTNNGPFVSGDYVETGATGGISNATRTKHLNTGFLTDTLSAGDRHLSAYARTWPNATYDDFIGSEGPAIIQNQFVLGYQNNADKVSFAFGSNTARISSEVISSGANWLGVESSLASGVLYRNGVSAATGTLTSASPPSASIFVFAFNRAATPAAADFFGGTLGSYSIGLSMTATQAADYNTAIQAFQTALFRRRPSSDPAFAAVTNEDAKLWIDNVYAAGSTVSQPVANAVSAFVDGCQADGIWDAMKSVVLLAGADTLAGALVPLKGTAPTNNNFVSGDYNPETGLVGNGSTKYLDSNRDNNSDPQDDVHLSVYVSAVVAYVANGGYIGAGLGASGTTRITPSNANGGTVACRSTTAVAFSAFPPVNFLGISRSNSSGYEGRFNGGDSTFTEASAAPGGNAIEVYRTYSGAYANARLAFYSIGESLDLAALDTRVSNLITAIGNAFAPAYADADVNAYISAVELADGGTMLEPAVRDAYNDFITGCKADGIWDAIKSSCILAGARTLAGALTPLVGAPPTNNNFVSGDYNRETGLVGNGTTKYLDSNRANNADPQDSKHISCYASNAGSATRRVMTSGWSANGASQLVRGSGYTARINAAYLSDVAIGTGTVASGFVGASRSSDSAISGRNGGTTSVDVAQASTSPNAENLLLYKGQLFSNARLAFYSIGESLDLDLLDTRVSALITAIENAI